MAVTKQRLEAIKHFMPAVQEAGLYQGWPNWKLIAKDLIQKNDEASVTIIEGFSEDIDARIVENRQVHKIVQNRRDGEILSAMLIFFLGTYSGSKQELRSNLEKTKFKRLMELFDLGFLEWAKDVMESADLGNFDPIPRHRMNGIKNTLDKFLE